MAFLPPGHAIANATREIDELFGDSGEISIVTLLFRGEALTPSGLTQMDDLIDEIVSEPGVRELLVPVGAVVAPSTVIGGLVQAGMAEGGGDGITQDVVDFAQTIPEIQAALDAMTGTDSDGTQVAIANIRLADTGDEQIQEAERRIYEMAAADEGLLEVSSLSPVIVEDEYTEATESGLALALLGLALLLIAVLLLLFTRTFSDMLLTLTGLIVSIVWIVGAEGWLGPNGLSLIGPPSSLTAMIPVIVISLTVDYAIQAISHYREQRIEGLPVVQAVRTGLRNVTIPLTLAAVTTIVSFLATLFSPIGVIADFGIVAGLGVGLSLIVMLTLIPAGRTIIDRRREARGRLSEPRAIANALPGITPIAEMLGRSVTRWPVPFLLVVIAITIGLGFAATGLKYEFSIKDILPRGGSVLRDMNTLESAVGGSTEIASILVKAEVTSIRTLLNLEDLTTAFDDETKRPPAAAGPIVTSYYDYLYDWIEDDGTPGDKYDPELAAMFDEASEGVHLDPALMQGLLDRLGAEEPELARFLVNDPNGIDAMLLQFPSYLGEPEETRNMQGEIEGLWQGDDTAVTVTSDTVISVAVTDQITDRQTEAIGTTVAVASGHPRDLLLGDTASTSVRRGRGGADRARFVLRIGHDGAPGYSLHADHFDHHLSFHRYRSGLHDSRNPSLPRRVRAPARSGTSGDPYIDDDRVCVTWICLDDSVGVWRSHSLAIAGVTTVRHHCNHHHRLLADGFHLRRAPGDGGLGRLPEHEVTVDG